ncbi:Ig-like domain-containing protein [Candidatus Palauibacter sp.]|uniref:Ig-like domain-containing protein n=1 Tax=Candidatus Palauibacter sp. TaxID=3101350 RepID=UPI003B026EC8
MAVGSIPAQVMIVGQSATVDVSPFFSDPDGGTLTYAATSSDAGVVSVSLTGSSLTATAVAAGTATVTVTATDPDGLTATQSAGVTVEAANQAPEAVGAIPPQTMTAGQTVTVDVSSFFSDPDGDELTYTAESSDADVLTASMSGSSLTATAVAAGTATVTVTAADPDGLTATQSAEVTVEAANQAPETVGTIPPQAMTEPAMKWSWMCPPSSAIRTGTN